MPNLTITVPSDSRPGTTYTVQRSERTGDWYCSCPSWRFQRVAPSVRSCKHIRGLVRSLVAFDQKARANA